MDFGNWGNSEGQFKNYFWQTYAPLLDKLVACPYEKLDLSAKNKLLLGHLRDDLKVIFK